MFIRRVDNRNINFGIYKKTIKKPYGTLDIGEYKDTVIEIYTAKEPQKNTLLHKLYYVSKKVGEWVETEFKSYKNGNCGKRVKSRNSKFFTQGNDEDA